MTGRMEAAPHEKGLPGRGAVTRELIIDTSTRLFAERGYAASTIRELTERAKLPLSAVYYYFPGKYELLLAIVDAAMARLEAGADAMAGAEGTAAERLAALVRHHVDVHLREPDAARIADRELRSLRQPELDAIIERRDRYEQLFRSILDDGVRAGEFSPGLRIPIASAAIITMSTAVIDWWHPGGALNSDETGQVLAGFAVALATGGAPHTA
jgi:AcrR family transcriptional regulator